MKTRKHYDKPFRERAVKLSYERGSVLQAAKKLEILKKAIAFFSRTDK